MCSSADGRFSVSVLCPGDKHVVPSPLAASLQVSSTHHVQTQPGDHTVQTLQVAFPGWTALDLHPCSRASKSPHVSMSTSAFSALVSTSILVIYP